MDCQGIWEKYKQKFSKEVVRSRENESLNLSSDKVEKRKCIQENFSILKQNSLFPQWFEDGMAN